MTPCNINVIAPKRDVHFSFWFKIKQNKKGESPYRSIYALTIIVTPVLCAACVIEVHKHIRWMVYSGGEG